ncbi:MAG: HAD-IB family hydrolase [Natronospirillum sp.]|uniref:histidinol-phosphatase n=1 Tax=Natronospirillum sp. TaxID=2812955 RepID=UPI0025DE609C|nr:HAD family hydrolase [Natronospirillum sp.]MCH8552551.1 HAD-IB family hydrolase [Natronospirillum sp.]
MALAIFDLDNTLLAGDSDHAWGAFLVRQGVVDTAEYQRANDYFYSRYQAGTLDIHEYVAFVVKPLQAMGPKQSDALRQHFLDTVISGMIAPGAKALLDKHRQQGDRLLIITATIDFITAPIAAELGVDDLLATVPERDANGNFTGRIDGTPAFQAGKITRLHNWLADQALSFDRQWFYSDSHNDLHLLEQVTDPVAVDPDDTLLTTAEARSWPVLSLR